MLDEIIGKLKEKAKTGWDIEYLLTHKRYRVLGVEWVRLEDAKEVIQQLKTANLKHSQMDRRTTRLQSRTKRLLYRGI